MAQARRDDRHWRTFGTELRERIPTPFYVCLLGVATMGLGAYLSATGRPEVAGLALAYSFVLVGFGLATYVVIQIAFMFDSFEG